MTNRRSLVVLTGGDGPEGHASLASGPAVVDALTSLGSRVALRDIGDAAALTDLHQHDLAYIATHGWTGEVGNLQGTLEFARVPYTGSGVLASAMAMYRPTANIMFEQAGLNVPPWRSLGPSPAHLMEARKWAAQRGYPLVARPATGGATLGSRTIATEADLDALVDVLSSTSEGEEFLISDQIPGHHVSVGLLWCRGRLEVLPILATSGAEDVCDVPDDQAARGRRGTCRAELDSATTSIVRAHSRTAFEALRCHGLARVDFIIDHTMRPWILDVDTVPGMSHDDDLATMADASGMGYGELVMSIATTAFSKTRKRHRP